MNLFFETPLLAVIDVNGEVTLEADRIRRVYGFKVPDSILLVAVEVAGLDLFLTNDRLRKIGRLR